ncbi:uncharacterized protein [Panulirus ornatus]|uniref:uncharacterized protein n=1 Tax=Panulirus ornatus TaxID=150431 RepID=UPI003A8980DB
MMRDEDRCTCVPGDVGRCRGLTVVDCVRLQVGRLPLALLSLLLLLAASRLAAAVHGVSGFPHHLLVPQSGEKHPDRLVAPPGTTPAGHTPNTWTQQVYTHRDTTKVKGKDNDRRGAFNGDSSEDQQPRTTEEPRVTELTMVTEATVTYTNQSLADESLEGPESGAKLFVFPIKNRCSIKVLQEDLDTRRFEFPNPLLSYIPQPEQRAEDPPGALMLAQKFGLSLPAGCEYMERQIQNAVICTGSNITEIPDFYMVRNLESLHFTATGIQRVTEEDTFPRSVNSLYFSSGSLSMFDGRKLYKIPDLDTLSLGYNTISTWSFVTTFDATNAPDEIKLKKLNLQNNLITYPPDPAGAEQTVLPHLETLAMNNNPLCNLPGKLFQPLRESPLTNLFLRNCSLGQFYGSPLEYVEGLEVLDLSNNMGLAPDELDVLLKPLKGGRLRELYLSNNNYGSVPTAALSLVNSTLETLDLHGSAFECLDNSSFPFMPRLTTLNLMYCRINTVRPNTFQSFPALRVLNLDGNGLVTVPAEVLLPTLQVLTLSENPRTTGNGGPEDFTMEAVTFKDMDNLTNMSFRGVPLGQVSISYFNDLHALRYLCLSSCKISYIERFSFRNLSKLEKLYLNENNIRILYNDTFAGLVNLKHLDLSDNKIVFHSNIEFTSNVPKVPREATSTFSKDGPLSPLQVLVDVHSTIVSWAQGGHSPELQVQEDQELASGHPTATLTKAQTVDLNSEEERQTSAKLLKTQPKTFLPFEGLEALQYLDLAENEIREVFPELWEDLHQLTYLSLGSNNVKEWDTPIFYNTSNLTTLLLRRNSLNILTEAMVQDFSKESLVKVDLQFNMFQCGCTIYSFNETLNITHFVGWSSYKCSEEGDMLFFSEYMANATCEDGPPIPIPEGKTSNYSVKTIIIAVSICLSVVMTSLTFYKKRWYVRYVMYLVKMRATAQKEDDDNYFYDTFVCYSQADRQWVFEHLVSKLEDDGRYRVCVHERDFTVGQEITENIINSVERSRKVVVVLSPSFVESSWCMFELQMASNKILDERKNKLILLLLEPILEEQQPKKLRLLLKTRTYIAWVTDSGGGEEQKLFWARLLRAIAKPLNTASSSSSDVADASIHL